MKVPPRTPGARRSEALPLSPASLLFTKGSRDVILTGQALLPLGKRSASPRTGLESNRTDSHRGFPRERVLR